MLLSWCRGQTLSTAVRDRPWDAFRLGMACGREQARLNATLASEPLGAARWLTRFGPLDAELRRRLERIENSHSGVLHFDCHTNNILVTEVKSLVSSTGQMHAPVTVARISREAGRCSLAASATAHVQEHGRSCGGSSPQAGRGARAGCWKSTRHGPLPDLGACGSSADVTRRGRARRAKARSRCAAATARADARSGGSSTGHRAEVGEP